LLGAVLLSKHDAMFAGGDAHPRFSAKQRHRYRRCYEPIATRYLRLQQSPTFVAPSLYTYGTFTVTQVFQFDDTATGQANVQIPGPNSGPFAIVRTVMKYDTNDYQYTITKAGKMDSLLLPD
jgi:hypothetical protein